MPRFVSPLLVLGSMSHRSGFNPTIYLWLLLRWIGGHSNRRFQTHPCGAFFIAMSLVFFLSHSLIVSAGGSCLTQTGCSGQCSSGIVCDSCVGGWQSCYTFTNGEACFLYQNCITTWSVAPGGSECGEFDLTWDDYPC